MPTRFLLGKVDRAPSRLPAKSRTLGFFFNGSRADRGHVESRTVVFRDERRRGGFTSEHVICIPLIVWSVLVALRLVTFSVPNVEGFEANFGLLTTIAYGMFYLAADKSAGFTW